MCDTKRGFHKNGKSCDQCKKFIGPTIFVVILGLGLCALSPWLCSPRRRGDLLNYLINNWFDGAKLKIVYTTAQIVGTISWATNADRPEPFATLASWMATVSSPFEALPFGCAVGDGYNYYSLLLSSTIVPLALFISLSPGLFREIPPACVCVCFFTGALCTNDHQKRQMGYAAVLLAFLVLPSTSLILFRLFDCIDFR